LRVRLDEPFWWYGAGNGAADAVTRCLAPIAAIYGRVAEWRHAGTTPYRARLPVICVGNLTAGGTGKTPLSLYLCTRLQDRGLRPVVLTRGYGGRRAGPHWVTAEDTADAVGDEALLLACAAPTLVARDRAAGARAIESAAASAGVAADLIVMDDGLQNPQLAKDLALAVVDGRRGLGNGRVIPAGPLRAPLGFQLGLVDAIVVNEPADGADSAVIERLAQLFKGPVLRCTTAVAGDAAWLEGRRVVAWAGIGAPQRFFDLLRQLRADVAEAIAFRDHQALSQADARRLFAVAVRHEATLVTTEKDMARLAGTEGDLADLAAATRVLPIEMRFAEPDAERLAVLVDGAVGVGRRAD
jgi:tetraacyldisaccharide 4'-kinase